MEEGASGGWEVEECMSWGDEEGYSKGDREE